MAKRKKPGEQQGSKEMMEEKRKEQKKQKLQKGQKEQLQKVSESSKKKQPPKQGRIFSTTSGSAVWLGAFRNTPQKTSPLQPSCAAVNLKALEPKEAVARHVLAMDANQAEGLARLHEKLPADGTFESLTAYQRVWEDVVLTEARAQCLNEARGKHRLAARCLSGWALLDAEAARGRGLRHGSIVLLESPLGPRSFGRVWMKDTAGVESEGLSGGVSVSAPGFGVAGSAREIQAIREVKRVAPALVHQLLGNLPPAGVDGSAGHLECLQSLNPSQAKAVGRALGCSGGFVSIHGPPGTGKSQTLLQLINALHLQRMQQYHQGIEDIALGVRGTGAAAAVSRREQWLRAVAHAPRLLVCAHSNNAVRQLQERLEKNGFSDQSGGRYVPWSVRVSAEGAGSSGSPDLDKEVAQLLQLSREEVGKQYQEVQEEMDQLAMQLKRLLYEIEQLQQTCPLPENFQAILNQRGKILFYHVPSGTYHHERPALRLGEQQVLPLQLPHVVGRMQELVSLSDRWWFLDNLRKRFCLLQDPPENWHQLRRRLEAVVLDAAQLVFATASSAARVRAYVSDAMIRSFDRVVIDEAGQATEPACLVPMGAGGRTCVLVGDHLQLPPTVFTPNAEELLMSRSLFERLCVIGHEPELLQEQYRMVPAISAFPRQHFYQGRLRDAELCLPQRCALIPAFLFLDLESSAAQLADGSWYNLEEAKFCAQLAANLQASALLAGREGLARSVGIITPYKAQKEMMQGQLRSASVKFPVTVATVDGYQGREMEAVICSTVRASHKSSSIGFVADDRRLNVALTRARQVLLVVGHARTLASSRTPAALIQHAKRQDAFRSVKLGEDVLIS